MFPPILTISQKDGKVLVAMGNRPPIEVRVLVPFRASGDQVAVLVVQSSPTSMQMLRPTGPDSLQFEFYRYGSDAQSGTFYQETFKKRR